MRAHLIQPVGKNTPSPRLPGEMMKDQQARQEQAAAQEKTTAVIPPEVDQIRLSQLVEEALEQEGKDEVQKPMEELNQELEELMGLVNDSNRKIQESAKMWEKMKPKPVPAPSTLGLTVSVASGKLRSSELKVTRIQREYSDTVKEGHVVAQIPSPGGNTTKERGVTLIVSMGPPPEQEKYDLVKRKEGSPVQHGAEEEDFKPLAGIALPIDGDGSAAL